VQGSSAEHISPEWAEIDISALEELEKRIDHQKSQQEVGHEMLMRRRKEIFAKADAELKKITTDLGSHVKKVVMNAENLLERAMHSTNLALVRLECDHDNYCDRAKAVLADLDERVEAAKARLKSKTGTTSGIVTYGRK
jgi:hypothetical protein